jgi:hypothetical protein
MEAPMQPYRNASGDSPVAAYETAPGSITVEFADGGTYLYTVRSSGKSAIADMQRLAAAGHGLATYISQHVRQRYAKKLR